MDEVEARPEQTTAASKWAPGGGLVCVRHSKIMKGGGLIALPVHLPAAS